MKRKTRKSKAEEIASCIAASPVVIVLVIIAVLCYLTQHTYNLLTGKGWNGMSL